MTSQLAICFAANIAVITLELALVTLELAFAAVGKLVSGWGATLRVQQYSHSSHLNGRSSLVTVARSRFDSVLAHVTHIRAFDGLDSNL